MFASTIATMNNSILREIKGADSDCALAGPSTLPVFPTLSVVIRILF
jgi:hypothetical protein